MVAKSRLSWLSAWCRLTLHWFTDSLIRLTSSSFRRFSRLFFGQLIRMLAATYGRNQLLTSEPKLRNQSWLSLLSLRLFLWMSTVFQIEKFWEDSVVFEWPKTEDLSAILEDGSGASVAFACGLSDGFRDDAVECSRFTGFQTQSECCQVKNLRPEHNQHWTENPKIHFSAFSRVVSLVCIRCSGLRWSAYRSKFVGLRSVYIDFCYANFAFIGVRFSFAWLSLAFTH